MEELALEEPGSVEIKPDIQEGSTILKEELSDKKLTEQSSEINISVSEINRTDSRNSAQEELESSDKNVPEIFAKGWYTDAAQLDYIAACRQVGTIPSDYFLRHMNNEVLNMNHCVLGPVRMKTILRSIGSNTTLTILNLADAFLGDDAINDLCMMFKENFTLKDVNLSDNRMSSKSAELLCDALASSTQLERVDLHGNRFCDKSGLYFSELMATSLRMSYLNLSYNNFGELSTVLFGRALPQATSLVELDLGWNRLGSGGMRQFSKGLAENKNLEILNLSSNGIGPRRGCRELALALKANKTLLVLDLRGNRISPEAAVLLSKGFYSNSTLRRLFLSRNPLQTAGCYATLNGILKNANNGLQELDLQGILVNEDFRQLQDTARITRPKLLVRGGRKTTEKSRAISSKWKEAEVSPKQVLQRLGNLVNRTLADALRHLDPPGEKRVTREAFIREIYKYLSTIDVDFTEEQMHQLMHEVDPNNEEEIDYRSFERGVQ